MIWRILACLTFSLAPTAANAAWREARSAHFIIYGDVSEKELREFSTKLERFDAVLRKVLPVPEGADANPLTVLLVPNQKAVAKVPGNSAKWAAGFYRAGPAGSYIVASRERDRTEFGMDAENMLYHEYAHHFMSQYFPIAYPGWYVEGFAEFVSTVDYDKKAQARIGRAAMHRLPYLVRSEKQLPFDRILATDTDSLKTDDEVESYYARSWLLTHYLMLSDARKGQLGAYLSAINRGRPPAEAAAVFGDMAALTKELDRYLSKAVFPYLTFLLPIPAPNAVAIRELRPAESLLAVERLQYLGGVPAEETDAFAAKVEAAARQFPADPLVLQLLATARFAKEDFAGADKAADAWLAVAPNNSRALLAKGMARIRLVGKMTDPQPADWKSARSWLVKANRADGNDPLPYMEYFWSFREEGESPPEVAFAGLERALDLAPQNQGLRLTVAMLLAHRGKFDDAAFVVRPLAFSPHPTASSKTAQEYLTAFQSKKIPD